MAQYRAESLQTINANKLKIILTMNPQNSQFKSPHLNNPLGFLETLSARLQTVFSF